MGSSDLLKFLPVIKHQKQSSSVGANRQFLHTKVRLLTCREKVDDNLPRVCLFGAGQDLLRRRRDVVNGRH